MLTEHAAWFLARGSGIVAYLLLTASTVWGLLLSTKVLGGGGGRARGLMLAHESLGLGAVLATVVHLVALVADNTVGFGWAEVLVVGASSWRPVAVAWGVAAFWALLVVTFSFYVRSRIGQKAWRWLHFGAFGSWAAATLHGIQAGTDAGGAGMTLLYLEAAAFVLALTLLRGVTYGVRRARARATAP